MEEHKEEYLTVEELAGRIKFSRQSIYNMIFKGEFILHQHYLKPRPKKILFKWSAVVAWMEDTPNDSNSKSSSCQDDGSKEKSLINI